jgi:hypothetical protein
MILKTAPNDNWLIDTRDIATRQQDELNKKVNRLTRVPRNSPAVVNQSFDVTYNDGLGDSITPAKDEQPGGFFAFPVSPPITAWYQAIQPPSFYNLSNVNDVKLNISLANVLDGNAVVASSSYSVDFYLSVYLLENINGQFSIGSDFNVSRYNISLFQVKQTYSHDPSISTTDYSFTNSEKTLFLSDTIPARNYAPDPPDYPDFTVNPEKIMKFQLDLIKQQPVYLYLDWGFNVTQANALATANKQHFRVMVGNFDNTPPSPFGGLLASKIKFNLAYSGTSSTYELLN